MAARGLDLPNLGLVIHADLPNDIETLQHRSGRTGRAGRKGVTVLLVTPKNHRRAERMLGQANIKASWVNPPTPEAIRQIDNERLLQSLLSAEAGEPEDIVLGRQLLQQRSAEDIAAALVHIFRARLPAPEDVIDTGMPPPREPYTGLANAVWFRLNVGRQRKADPKWLIPEICRQGGVTKREIGAIRIFDEETKFEIAADAAEAFKANVAKVKKGDIFIGESEAPADGGHVRRPPPAGKKEWKSHYKGGRDDKAAEPPRDKPRWAAKGKPHGEKSHGEKSHGDKSHESKPHAKKPYEGKPYERKSQEGKPHGKEGFGGKHKAGKYGGKPGGKPGGYPKRPKPR